MTPYRRGPIWPAGAGWILGYGLAIALAVTVVSAVLVRCGKWGG